MDVAPVGVVLAGGRSARMGRDKALVEVDGVPMARRVADALVAGGCDPVWCQGGDTEALSSIGLTVRPDEVRHAGPLVAIEAALVAASPGDVVVAACDLPGLDGATISRLVTIGRRAPGRPACAAADASGAHLVAWFAGRALDPVRELRAAGVVSYRSLLDRLGAELVAVPAHVVRNVNRPDDVT